MTMSSEFSDRKARFFLFFLLGGGTPVTGFVYRVIAIAGPIFDWYKRVANL